ncbi:hypothetical protein [Herbaspirillum sp. RV1423]|uniref:hypothetical protein n=1 Tax=Herbaspirillum sp. RV1423 TaxID=1443993 RepID=UPI0004B57FF7|nr:hypothetical protein [Herbaspirillum sp. RV1423]
MSDPILRQDDANHVRLKQILAELEVELQKISADSPQAENLKNDFSALKSHLDTPEVQTHVLREHIGKTRNSAQELMDSVEGAILKDSPYIAELGRILGMI